MSLKFRAFVIFTLIFFVYTSIISCHYVENELIPLETTKDKLNNLLFFGLKNELPVDEDYGEVSAFKRSFGSYELHTQKKRYGIVNYDGYTLNVNVDLFKSNRLCRYREECKLPSLNHFQCVCPRGTLCVARSYFSSAKCGSSLMPYVWIQTAGDSAVFRPKL